LGCISKAAAEARRAAEAKEKEKAEAEAKGAAEKAAAEKAAADAKVSMLAIMIDVCVSNFFFFKILKVSMRPHTVLVKRSR